jgi:hypothetical protein
LTFELRDDETSKLVINLETGELKSTKESLKSRFETMIGHLLQQVRGQKTNKIPQPHPYFQKTGPVIPDSKNFPVTGASGLAGIPKPFAKNNLPAKLNTQPGFG